MRIAVIGSGGIARRHLDVITRVPDLEIAGHVTRRPERAAVAAARWGGRPYTDHHALLARERVDAAWVCVPPNAHGDIERSLVERGIPFVVEKPIDADCRTGDELATLIAQTGVIVGVAYHWRAMDTIPAVRSMLQDRPARMVIGSWLSSTPPPTWWHHQAEGGGQIVEQATHLFDLARYLIGEAEPVATVAERFERAGYPELDVAVVSAALLRFRQGAAGSFNATCLLAGAEDVSLRLVCEGRLITITQGGARIDEADRSREVPLGNDPFVAEDSAFLDAVNSGDPSLLYCDYEDALRTQRLCCSVRDLSSP